MRFVVMEPPQVTVEGPGQADVRRGEDGAGRGSLTGMAGEVHVVRLTAPVEKEVVVAVELPPTDGEPVLEVEPAPDETRVLLRLGSQGAERFAGATVTATVLRAGGEQDQVVLDRAPQGGDDGVLAVGTVPVRGDEQAQLWVTIDGPHPRVYARPMGPALVGGP